MADQQAVVDPTAIDPALATWHRLWLQAHERRTPSTDLLRQELAAFRARLDAIRYQGTTPASEIDGLPDVPGPAELMERLVARAAGPAAGEIVPALVPTGRPELRIERSRPGWRLSGTASILGPSQLTVSGSARLASFAIDEGDNEVLVVVAIDAPGVRVGLEAPDSVRDVSFSAVELTDQDIVSGLHEYAVMRDQVAMHVLIGALQAAASLSPAGRWPDELALARASARAAAQVAGGAQLTRRSTAVSAAVVQVMPLCRSIAATADPGSSAASVIDAAQAFLCPPWHLTRLAALL